MNSNNQFVVKPWGDADRSIIGTIWNTYLKYRNPENYIEHKQDAVDKVFGKDINFSRDVLRFENEKGEIVGYAGLTNNSGESKNWNIAYTILPEYLDTSLPEMVVKECISLAEKSDIAEVHMGTRVTNNAFKNVFTSLGFTPFHYAWGMHMVDIGSKNLPFTENPKGITIRQVEALDDYSKYSSIENDAFRSTYDYVEKTPEECKDYLNFQRKYFEVKIVVAYEEKDNLVGFGLIVIDNNTNFSYGRILAVHQDYRNRGIGSSIIYHVLKYLKNQGIKEYRFHVNSENERVLDLYKRYGFQVLEKTTSMRFQLK